MIIFAIGMLAILAMAGLALDGSHMLLNKTRLQNSVDMAALATAHEANSGASPSAARRIGQQMLIDNAAASGNREFEVALGVFAAGANNECGGNQDASDVDVCIEYSNSYPNFVPGNWLPGDLVYVRVRVTGFTLPNYLIQVLNIIGFNPSKTVGASAIAGPSPRIGASCNLVPLIYCADANDEDNNWGIDKGTIYPLKFGAEAQGGGTDGPETDTGHGTFHLADLGSRATQDIAEALAGGKACADPDGTVGTAGGNRTTPIAKAINSRFFPGNTYDPTKYKPDVVTTGPEPELSFCDSDNKCNGQVPAEDGIYQGPPTPANKVEFSDDIEYSHDEYMRDVLAGVKHNANGEAGRRTLSVIMAECVDLGPGQTGSGTQEFKVLDTGCFHLLQPMAAQGGGKTSFVFGEFLKTCQSEGNSGPIPDNGDGPYRIQLYHDFNSFDS